MFMMKHEGVSVLLIVGLVTASKLSSGLSCCNTYVVHTEATYNQTVHGDNCVCYSTLSKLTKLESNTEKDVEVLFQPGVHSVKNSWLSISVYNISSLLIKGDHKTNTTIKCLNQFEIHLLKEGMTVKIQDICIENCTLNFEKQIFGILNFKFEVAYSMLNDSGILFSNSITPTLILIQNTDITNYLMTSPHSVSQGVLDFTEQNICTFLRLNITLQNLNFVYNNQSLLQLSEVLASYIAVSVTITGTNCFIHNKNPIIYMYSFGYATVLHMYFLRANVQIVENL